MALTAELEAMLTAATDVAELAAESDTGAVRRVGPGGAAFAAVSRRQGP